MPRDIDDLHSITHCQDELHAPFGDFQGPFGFGRYENGQSRGNYCDPDLSKLAAASTSGSAAARRSDDPGAIELNAQIPLPPSLDSVLCSSDVAHCSSEASHAHTLSSRWAEILSQDSDDGRMLSHLPFHWEGKKNDNMRVEASGNQIELSVNEAACSKPSSNDNEWHKMRESRLRTKSQLDFATSCMRKWRISMKVGGVSSRTTLFPPSYVTRKGEQTPEKARKCMRPMLCFARLPQSAQSGQTVSVEMASEMDTAGLAQSLGSYDCRFADNLINPKKEGVSRAKRIELGRTRIVWSNLVQGDATPYSRNRVNFNSLITGKRLDSSQCKRPLDVKVGVRLNGRIIMEEALLGDPTVTVSNPRKRKHSTRQTETEGQVSMLSVECPESRTYEEIDAAINSTSFWPENSLVGDAGEGAVVVKKSVVYVEEGGQARSDIERSEIIADLMKFSQKKSAQKKVKRSVSGGSVLTEATSIMSLGGNRVVEKYNPPRIACVPLEDGLVRSVCLSAGNMIGKSVNQILDNIANEELERMCTICWSNEGSGNEGVQECTKCGLLAHTNCCFDKGKCVPISNGDSVSTNRSYPAEDTMQDTMQATMHSNTNTQLDTVRADACDSQWICAVCCHSEVKPRRNARMPSRFVDGETYASPNHGIASNANLPGPQCSFCPHRGGAMSPLGPQNGAIQCHTRWVHEVCRIWTGFNNSNELDTTRSSISHGSHFTNVCALCGTGGDIHKKSTVCHVGLTRCAARGCLVSFHPMCALLASKSKEGMEENSAHVKTVRTRMTRHSSGQSVGNKKSDEKDNSEADKKLCNEYTLQLVQLTSAHAACEEESKSVIPIAFCGIHNPQRDDASYGCLPGGTAI